MSLLRRLSFLQRTFEDHHRTRASGTGRSGASTGRKQTRQTFPGIPLSDPLQDSYRLSWTMLGQGSGERSGMEHYAQEVYRHSCRQLVSEEHNRPSLPPRSSSARQAWWLRRRATDLEPLDCGHEVRKELEFYRDELDHLNRSWEALVTCRMGDNDHYHKSYWASLYGEDEKRLLDAGSQLLQQQLRNTCRPVVAEALHKG